jgi:hypothetical protein
MSLLELVIACCGVGVMVCIVPLAIKSYKDMLESLK